MHHPLGFKQHPNWKMLVQLLKHWAQYGQGHTGWLRPQGKTPDERSPVGSVLPRWQNRTQRAVAFLFRKRKQFRTILNWNPYCRIQGTGRKNILYDGFFCNSMGFFHIFPMALWLYARLYLFFSWHDLLIFGMFLCPCNSFKPTQRAQQRKILGERFKKRFIHAAVGWSTLHLESLRWFDVHDLGHPQTKICLNTWIWLIRPPFGKICVLLLPSIEHANPRKQNNRSDSVQVVRVGEKW